VEHLFVPGEMEWEKYARAMQEGITLPSDVVESLQDSATQAGLKLADYV
jgi:LDH2 family malate/lactate/ureidoglycolate dehydrogenase